VLWAEAWWGHRHHYAAGWYNPWILGEAKLGVGLDGYFENYSFVYLPFDFQDAGARVHLWREALERVRLDLAYTYRSTVIYNSASSELRPVPGTTVDPHLEIGVEWDSRNLRYYPSRGVHAKAGGNFGGLGGDLNSYAYYDLHLAGFISIPRLGILAGRVSHRGTSDPLPVYERSYLGGPETVRGVEFSSLRGDRNLLATIELRRPIFLVPLRDGRAVGLGLHGFVDWGQAWEHDFETSKIQLRHAGGVGIHLNLNTYNLRFEWAWSDHDGNSFVFADQFNF
jgi:outer membrane protein assembly factor BamA